MTKKKEKDICVTDLPGVGVATAEKLAQAGFTDLMSIATISTGALVELTGMTEMGAKKVINSARDSLDMGFVQATEYEKARERIFHITTGVPAFDSMLGGGVESGATTECFGEYGSSKTQIAHQLAVNVQLLDENNQCVYIDTEGSFRPDRIRQMARGKGLDEDKILKNVIVGRAYNCDHQMLLAEKIDELIKIEKKPIKLIIVDSLTSHFRAEFVGRGMLADRQQKINRHIKLLSKLGDIHNVVIYVTNQVSVDPSQMFGDPTKAIGGHIVGHNSTFRIYLRKGKRGSRVAKLVDAPNLPDAETIFNVVEAGLKE